MFSWWRRLFGSADKPSARALVPPGTEHDYRPGRCNRSHDWGVLSGEDAAGSMRIEAWGSRFRAGDRIMFGDPARTWWVVNVTRAGNTWFPDRALLDLAHTIEGTRSA